MGAIQTAARRQLRDANRRRVSTADLNVKKKLTLRIKKKLIMNYRLGFRQALPGSRNRGAGQGLNGRNRLLRASSVPGAMG
jgi:hypothetical protein